MLIAHSNGWNLGVVASWEQLTKGRRISFWLDILIADFLHLNGYSFIIYIEFAVYFHLYTFEIRKRILSNDNANAWTNFQTSFHLNASAFQVRLSHLQYLFLKCFLHDTQTSKCSQMKQIFPTAQIKMWFSTKLRQNMYM